MRISKHYDLQSTEILIAIDSDIQLLNGPMK